MKAKNLEFNDYIKLIFPEAVEQSIKTLTFQLTEECSLRCSYCYQINKSPSKMNFNIAKKTIDYLFENRKNENFYFNENTTQGIIIDFIGGEPLLEIDLATQIIDYFEIKLLENYDCPWVLFHKYSFSSNGVAYFQPKVQNLIDKYGSLINISITIDGNKELHDKCRKFPNGTGSYDIAIQAALDQLKRGNDNTKITISPENVQYLSQGVISMINLGFTNIHANCVFEEGWELSHAKIFYSQLKIISDYIISNSFQDSIYFSLFDVTNYTWPKTDINWCGSNQSMLAVDYKGLLYPCIRFMPSSLGINCEPYIIGDITLGLGYDLQTQNRLIDLNNITRTSQSTQQCKECSISSGCSWCTGYNYQKFGTINKRTTFTCLMHRASALASKYFYKQCKNKIEYEKIQLNDDKIALEIISNKEWNNIKTF